MYEHLQNEPRLLGKLTGGPNCRAVDCKSHRTDLHHYYTYADKRSWETESAMFEYPFGGFLCETNYVGYVLSVCGTLEISIVNKI